MGENLAKDGGDLGILKRLAVLVLFVNPVLFWFVLGIMFTGEDNIGLPLFLAPLLWLGCFPVLVAGYLIKREPDSRRFCAAGLAMFALMLCCMGYSVWYHYNGVWQPWRELSYGHVSSVELRSREGNKVVVLTAEEQQQACRLVSELKVQNPNVFTWGEMRIPDNMPRQEGAWTDSILFWKYDGTTASLTVGYPYYDYSHLAADLEACREVENFINGLSEKYK